ncbi:hypothetical protein UPYG_G00318450 [Umbra pygmaea]|uniref:Uncharacterized protein n=1 Tax=Umbra pygmaea TaxID=75934 RepID=A0ABD0WIL3_UMBPY
MKVNIMRSPQVLQPVLKMKVDELFLNWLSEPMTQTMLKDYLGLIKNGQSIESRLGNSNDIRSMTFNENNNVASKRSLIDRRTTPLNAPSSPPSAHTLPSGSGSNGRVVGPNGRALRRSVSTKKAQVKSEEPVTTAK